MIKLVYKYQTGDEGRNYDKPICFEYKSKEDFLIDIFNKYDKYYRDRDEHYICFEMLEGIYLGKNQVDNIENSIFTLEEWWEESKIKI